MMNSFSFIYGVIAN